MKTKIFFLIRALASILCLVLALITGHWVWWAVFGLSLVSSYFYWMGMDE